MRRSRFAFPRDFRRLRMTSQWIAEVQARRISDRWQVASCGFKFPGLSKLAQRMTHPGIAVMLVVGVGLGAVLYYFFASPPEPPLSNRRQRSSHQSETNRTYWPSSPTDARNRRQDQKCTICLEDTNKDDDVLIIPCKHVFHKLCIEEWRKNGHGDARQRCPVCRDRIESLEKL